jgi:multicomponent Na+:H+ antiporter subunit D
MQEITYNSNLIILPLLLPLLVGICALLRERTTRRRVAVIALVGVFAVSVVILLGVARNGIMVSQAGGHPAPYGIALVVDPLSALMLVVSGVIGVVGGLYSTATIDANRERFAYYPLLAFLFMGINFAFLTGDLFTLYVSFEVMLMSSFVLLTLGGERAQIEGGIKYVTLNLISSMIFLMATGLTYASVGTLNMAHLAQRVATADGQNGITIILATLFLVAFGIKAAIFPLFFWLPASYHTPPVAVTAVFGALLTKVGVYAMIRVLGMIFPRELATLQPILLGIAAFTMITGVLGAIAQMDTRRLLSFHIISQIGYLMLGLALFTVDSLSGTIFFMIHVIFAKTALFFISGVVYTLRRTYDLKKLGNLAKSNFGLAALFLLAAFSLAGVPPFSGFWAKLAIVSEALRTGNYLLTAVALVVSLLTFYSMLKIWDEAYWKPAPAPAESNSNISTAGPARRRGKRTLMMTATLALVMLVIVIGLAAEPIYRFSQQAATMIVDPRAYIRAVLAEDVP